MVLIHRKTAKGQAEIETRAHRLAPRLRSALILVDGKRSDDELSRLVLQDPEGTLKALIEGGFIEPHAVVAPPPPPPTQAPPPPVAAPSFDQFRRDAVRALTDLVGPMAEAVGLRIEKARNTEELRPLLQLAMQVIANTRGRDKAVDYGRRFGVEPPP
jgi:hypothetical protein